MSKRNLFGAALLLLFLGITTSACSSQLASNSTTIVSGKIELHENWAPRLFVLRPTSYANLLASYQMPVVDTIDLGDDGSFEWRKELSIQDEGLYVLMIQKKTSKYVNGIESLPFGLAIT